MFKTLEKETATHLEYIFIVVGSPPIKSFLSIVYYKKLFLNGQRYYHFTAIFSLVQIGTNCYKLAYIGLNWYKFSLEKIVFVNHKLSEVIYMQC
jgi:hypothetical protein